MNLPYELSKVRDGFRRVREDLNFMKGKIGENLDEFMLHHQKLAHQVEALSNEVQQHLTTAKETIIHELPASDKQFQDLKQEIKDLKKHILGLEKEHNEVAHEVNSRAKVKNYDSELKSMKEKTHSVELEMYLLKERMIEKDIEVKQLRDVNQRLFEIVNELAKVEMELANR
jgi:septal ring factor EnvC (AmiA/AmiB activator)